MQGYAHPWSLREEVNLNLAPLWLYAGDIVVSARGRCQRGAASLSLVAGPRADCEPGLDRRRWNKS